MGRRVFAFATVLVGLPLAVASPAAAQESGAASYGGGQLIDRPSGSGFPGHVGDADVAVRTNANRTRAHVHATHIVRCGRTTGEAEGYGRPSVRADGTFTLRSRRRATDSRLVMNVRVTGRIDSVAGRVTGEVVSTMRRPSGRRACAGTTTFTSLFVPRPTAAPAPAPGGALLAGLVRAGRNAPFSMLLRTTPDATAITRLVIALPWNCGRRIGDEVFYERGGAIAPDGTFRIANTYDVRFSNGRERGRIVIEGRFLADGGASGTVRGTGVFRDRRGRVAARCRSGTRSFALRRV
jgi:hypothetical protein